MITLPSQKQKKNSYSHICEAVKIVHHFFKDYAPWIKRHFKSITNYCNHSSSKCIRTTNSTKQLINFKQENTTGGDYGWWGWYIRGRTEVLLIMRLIKKKKKIDYNFRKHMSSSVHFCLFGATVHLKTPQTSRCFRGRSRPRGDTTTRVRFKPFDSPELLRWKQRKLTEWHLSSSSASECEADLRPGVQVKRFSNKRLLLLTGCYVAALLVPRRRRLRWLIFAVSLFKWRWKTSEPKHRDLDCFLW